MHTKISRSQKLYPLNENAGYAEYKKGSSTSHGKNRAKIIEYAINKMLNNGAGINDIEAYMNDAIRRFGYSIECPAMLRLKP